jgi:hypothetical protein
MVQMRTIEIDFDIHQMIELERHSFEEPENEALRRLLKLEKRADSTKSINPTSTEPEDKILSKIATGRSWSGKSVELPHGTELRMEYNGQVYRGVIDDGTWFVEGRRTSSPSDAAGSAATTKGGTRPSLNGWIYWEVKRPSDAHWRTLKSLKPRK